MTELHGFLVEVDLWNSRDPFVKFELVLHLLDIWDWLAAAFLCGVLLLLLRLVAVRSPLVCFACYWLCSFRLLLALLFLPVAGINLLASYWLCS